jgi:guanosine-3',5'-bis(diphosphate) 3'-pyrophosphohydrolase
MTFTEDEIKQLLKALEFAAEKHRLQKRKDVKASPYINHPIALANILGNEGHVIDIEILCAALLHDTIENTDTTAEELSTKFSPSICNIVMEVTDDKTLPSEQRKQLQIEHAAQLSNKAKLVKLADKIANLREITDRTPADWSLQRRQAYFDWGKQVIDQLRGVHPQLEAAFDIAYAKRP